MALSIIREQSNAFSKLYFNLSSTRSMGGGPRTFPGGINKWQWKRLHEKKAKEKEIKLLEQEKQLYQARIRSQIRAKLAGKADQNVLQSSEISANCAPMTAQDHVKALADRFMKEGAEDLWNEDDGPVAPIFKRAPTMRRPSLINPRQIVSDHRNLADKFGSLETKSNSFKRRFYSTTTSRMPRKNWHPPNSNDLKLDTKSEGKIRFYGSDDYSESDSDESPRYRSRSRKIMSSAALGDYDMKKVRRASNAVRDENSFEDGAALLQKELTRDYSAEIAERPVEEENLISHKRFEECDISPLTIKALSLAGYIQMTVVQEASLPVCLEGKDVLVKAKTGTGKSAAFLLPAIEAVLKAANIPTNLRISPIFILILCPTRELASQVSAEANVLLRFHHGIGVQTVTGGTRFKLDKRRLELDPCQIIVATPGRLLDHIEDKSNFSMRLMGLKMLILDEADLLLSLGFRKDIERIVDCLPRQRQSLLFSATIPKEVRRISQLVLRKDHTFIDTVGIGKPETHDKVLQFYFVVPHELHFQIIPQLLRDHIAVTLDYKVIVFCTTAMVTSLLFTLLQDLKMNVREIHSRKPQLYRTRIADEFRESKRLILVTSDVSARGMNYPDVTLVLQMGIPLGREEYIHRLGRTGREGKEGEGILLLAPCEAYFIDEIKDLPIQRSSLPPLDSDMSQKVVDSMSRIDKSLKEAAYHSWLGYYNSIRDIGRDKTELVELADKFSASIGLPKSPPLFRKTALKMGLKGITGIRIRK